MRVIHIGRWDAAIAVITAVVCILSILWRQGVI